MPDPPWSPKSFSSLLSASARKEIVGADGRLVILFALAQFSKAGGPQREKRWDTIEILALPSLVPPLWNLLS